MNRQESPNFDDRPANVPVDMLVLHYTGMKSAADALERLCDPAAKVSAHYFINTNGAVTALVDEDKRAWHVGVSYWRGHTDINARSIGIELVNPGHEFGCVTFPEKQMAALIKLAKGILKRHAIEARNVVGHSDVAPQRKMDPGELFDWQRLAAAGIGLWFDVMGTDTIEPASDADLAKTEEWLSTYGYETTNIPATLTAFQRHFRTDPLHGLADTDTVSRLKKLLGLVAE